MPMYGRAKVPGIMNERDRHWKLTDPNGNMFGMTDYNWEITGHTKGLPEEIKYGGNAYYWTYLLVRRGWKVEPYFL